MSLSGNLIKPLDVRFSVCKVKDYSGIDLTRPFCFIGTTDEENSLVCPEETVPENTLERKKTSGTHWTLCGTRAMKLRT